jgi:hypothetical protein
MKKIPLLIWATLIVNALSAQDFNYIKKNNWMVGGRAMWSSQTQDIDPYEIKRSSFGISPDVGYFFMDKFAGGLRFDVDYDKTDINNNETKQTDLVVSPWLRYYFLQPEKDLNIFAQGKYGIGSSKVNDNDAESISKWALEGGLAYFCNPLVALEFTLGYRSTKYEGDDNPANSLFFSVGFQIHLNRCGDGPSVPTAKLSKR